MDWKNKVFKIREAHDTNPILIQQEYITEPSNQSNVALIPDIVSIETFIDHLKV